jgi:hypothetical protein
VFARAIAAGRVDGHDAELERCVQQLRDLGFIN